MHRVIEQCVTLGQVDGTAGLFLVRGREQLQYGHECTIGPVQNFDVPLVRLLLND